MCRVQKQSPFNLAWGTWNLSSDLQSELSWPGKTSPSSSTALTWVVILLTFDLLAWVLQAWCCQPWTSALDNVWPLKSWWCAMPWRWNTPCGRSKSPGGCTMKTWWGFMRFWRRMDDHCPETPPSWVPCTSSRSAWRRIWLGCWNKDHWTQVKEAKGNDVNSCLCLFVLSSW